MSGDHRTPLFARGHGSRASSTPMTTTKKITPIMNCIRAPLRTDRILSQHAIDTNCLIMHSIHTIMYAYSYTRLALVPGVSYGSAGGKPVERGARAWDDAAHHGSPSGRPRDVARGQTLYPLARWPVTDR